MNKRLPLFTKYLSYLVVTYLSKPILYYLSHVTTVNTPMIPYRIIHFLLCSKV